MPVLAIFLAMPPVLKRLPLSNLLVLFLLISIGKTSGADKKATPVDFNAQIRPIISAKCYHCHGPDEESREAKLRLDIRDEAIRDRSGTFAIKPGDWQKSELITRVTSKDPDEVMPPPKTGHHISPQEVALLKQWITEGAHYAEHWAFQKPKRPELPRVKSKSWPNNPIDHFVLAKLEANKLKPSPQADRYSLIRRVSIDLTGLPPTPEEVQAFVTDKSPDAYEKVVNRLLSSPAFGEKWARMWLDIARYADSAGYGSDPLRLNIWPYRDWLIKAFNQNVPYDRFTLEQIAGDLLENPTEEQMTATAFHRNTMTNTEGGTDDEEWRVAAVKDRVNVTAQAWMGLTFGCAQCHTHKFDPITQLEYYQFYAFFNQTEDNDQPDERPTLPLPTKEEREKMKKLSDEIAELEKKLESGSDEVRAELVKWEASHNLQDAWNIFEPVTFQTAEGTKLKKLDDNSLLASGKAPAKEVYTVTLRADSSNVSALRLEVLPDASLPRKGPGRSNRGNFILNEIRASLVPDAGEIPKARYIRVELPGGNRILSLAEVEIFDGTNNIARTGKASQSSTDYGGSAEKAIDGMTNGIYDEGSITHTKTESNPWWEVDLGSEQAIEAVQIWNRTDSAVGDRLKDFRVVALDAKRQTVWESSGNPAPQPSARLSLTGEQPVRLRNATASFSQKSYEVTKAIDGKLEKESGWGVMGEVGKPQEAVFEFSSPLRHGTLKIELHHTAGNSQTLGRFRFSTTTLPSPVLALPGNVSDILARAPEVRSTEENEQLLKWFQQYATATAKLQQQVTGLRAQIDAIKPLSVPVMRELPDSKQRITRFLNKGNFLDPADPVQPGVPEAFHPWPVNAPSNRLGVAQWLMDAQNPLTARVAANRFWSQIFGNGIVETEEDFGTQGTLPSHPELLDWLALEFQSPDPSLRSRGQAKESEHPFDQPTPWNMKRMLKLIVMSATYQQTSRVTPELLEKDPRNLLLSRAPRRRLDAEMVRDQALQLSGLLSRKIGGPSVYPPQPDNLWRAAFNGQRSYPTSTGEDRYRRGLYTIWRRTVPYPSMATFDAPSRETCTFRRLPTNTPLQAYVTLNDPVYVEAAQALGRKMIREGGATVEERIRYGLRLVLARPERSADVQELVKLYQAELAFYLGSEQDATKLATQPLGPLPEGVSAAEAAAWTVIANVLLNLDGVLTKG